VSREWPRSVDGAKTSEAEISREMKGQRGSEEANTVANTVDFNTLNV